MRRRPTLALIGGPVGEGLDALEFLRLVVALVANGHEVRLLVLDEGRDVFATSRLHEEIERHLDALATFDVTPRPVEEGDLAAALASASSLLRHPLRDRPGEPPFLLVTPTTPATAIRDAGQVALAAGGPPSPG